MSGGSGLEVGSETEFEFDFDEICEDGGRDPCTGREEEEESVSPTLPFPCETLDKNEAGKERAGIGGRMLSPLEPASAPEPEETGAEVEAEAS